MKEKYIIIEGNKIFYRENIVNKEDKNVLFFMHGWGASSDLFLRIFPKDKNWIAIDFPNFGKSSKIQEAWDMEKYSEITKRFMDKTMTEKNIFFVVHSFGGRVLLKMMNDFSVQFEETIFMGVPFYRTETKKVKKTTLLIKYFHKIFDLPILNIIKKPLQKVLYKAVYSEDYLALQNNEIMQKTFKNVVSDDIAQYVPLLQNTKNILIWGKDDPIIPLKIPEKFIENTNNSELHLISRSGHFPFLENTKEFLEIFNKIIK